MSADSDKPDIDPRQVEAFEPLPGDLLLTARRSRGMSTAKAAAALNLDESVVLALEENRFEDLGAPVFARGHLRKYARLLDLNPDDVIRAYDAIATEQSAAALNVSPAVAQPVSGSSSGGWLGKGLVVIAVGAVMVLAWRMVRNGDVEEQPPAVVAPVTTIAPGPGDSAGPPGEEELVQPPAPRPPRETPATEREGQGTEAAVESTESQEPAVSGDQVQAGGPATEAAAGPTEVAMPPSAGVAGALVFEFTQDSWLEVRDADGRQLAYELGRKGRRRTITGQAPFRISLGYWPGVSLSYGGQAVTIPESARQGNTARFSVPSGADD